jgi:hypothetical protein
MTGTLAVPECPAVISPNGFGDSNAMTLTLDAPTANYRYRANLSLDIVSSATASGGVVVLYLDTSVDNGATFTNRAANSHQINTGIDSEHSGHPAEGRQVQIWMPLTPGSHLGVDNTTPPPSILVRSRAQLISGNAGEVEVFSNAEEAGDGHGDCSEQVSGLNGTIHMELEECF